MTFYDYLVRKYQAKVAAAAAANPQGQVPAYVSITPQDVVDWSGGEAGLNGNMRDLQKMFSQIAANIQSDTQIKHLMSEVAYDIDMSGPVPADASGRIDALSGAFANTERKRGRSNYLKDELHPDTFETVRTRLEKTLGPLAAMAENSAQTPYPALRFYYTATVDEGAAGMTRDFRAKHVATTQNADGPRRTAEIRAQPRHAKVHTGFGNQVTKRNSMMTREAEAPFCSEIKSRQAEFRAVYDAVQRQMAERVRAGAGKTLFDGLTFVTRARYKTFDTEVTATGGMNRDDAPFDRFVHFSLAVAAAPAGKGGAPVFCAHHMARTCETGAAAAADDTSKISLSGLGVPEGTGDPRTYLNRPS